jgi:hypothetical protein
MLNRTKWFGLFLLAFPVGCGGGTPAQSTTPEEEIAALEAGSTWVEPEQPAAEEPPTRGGSTVGEEFAQGVQALTQHGPCDDVAGDMAAYDECMRHVRLQPCRDGYMGSRDHCFDLPADERGECVEDAQDEYRRCMRQAGYQPGH